MGLDDCLRVKRARIMTCMCVVLSVGEGLRLGSGGGVLALPQEDRIPGGGRGSLRSFHVDAYTISRLEK